MKRDIYILHCTICKHYVNHNLKQDRSYEDTRTKAEKEQITLECCQLIQKYENKLPIERLPEVLILWVDIWKGDVLADKP